MRIGKYTNGGGEWYVTINGKTIASGFVNKSLAALFVTTLNQLPWDELKKVLNENNTTYKTR